MIHKAHKTTHETFITPAYGGRAAGEPVPKYQIPQTGLAPEIAYALIRDELILDGNWNVPAYLNYPMRNDMSMIYQLKIQKCL